jgi:hypothetical protein
MRCDAFGCRAYSACRLSKTFLSRRCGIMRRPRSLLRGRFGEAVERPAKATKVIGKPFPLYSVSLTDVPALHQFSEHDERFLNCRGHVRLRPQHYFQRRDEQIG